MISSRLLGYELFMLHYLTILNQKSKATLHLRNMWVSISSSSSHTENLDSNKSFDFVNQIQIFIKPMSISLRH